MTVLASSCNKAAPQIADASGNRLAILRLTVPSGYASFNIAVLNGDNLVEVDLLPVEGAPDSDFFSLHGLTIAQLRDEFLSLGFGVVVHSPYDLTDFIDSSTVPDQTILSATEAALLGAIECERGAAGMGLLTGCGR